MRAQPRTIRAFPGVPLPVPPVQQCAEIGLIGEFVCFALDSAPGKVPEEELYLRGLAKLPVDDQDELIEFIEAHGPVAGPDLTCLPAWSRDYLLGGKHTVMAGVHSPVGLIGAALLSRPPHSDFAEYLLERYGNYHSVHIDIIRLHLRLVRDLYRTWRGCESNGRGLKWLSRDQETTWLMLPGNLDAAHARLADFLSASCRPYHPRLEFDEERSGPARLGLGTRDRYTYVHGTEDAWLYSALCLQLLNDITQNVKYRVCQNESCRGEFVHQLGRSTYYHRSDERVLYCCAECARIQSQREQRRKKRVVLKLAAEGATVDEIADREWPGEKLEHARAVIERWLAQSEMSVRGSSARDPN